MKLLTIIGARPQFIKASALSNAIKNQNLIKKNRVRDIILHTGQHYDLKMSESMFKELKLPKPKYNLEIKSFTHGEMTGKMLTGIENKIDRIKPDHIITYGDTNSTLAAAIASSKLDIPLSHIESGLRSYNRKMPEEINRIITDHVSDYLFCPSEMSVKNLKKEGIVKNVFLTGDVMYDVYLNNIQRSQKSSLLKIMQLEKNNFILVTIHRPVNTDNKGNIKSILYALDHLSKFYKIVFAVHPRTQKKISDFGLSHLVNNLTTIVPLSYLEMIGLLKNCRLAITDSGGLQKEAYYSKKNCITIRDETEWPETLRNKANILTKPFKKEIIKNVKLALSKKTISFPRIYGDGSASQKILKILLKNKP